MKLKPISLLIILGGIFFSLYLQGQVADGVYFSGDGGLKALLAKQLAKGDLQFSLVLPEVSWVRELWNAGLYPYQEPYVYQVLKKYYITFPYTFPLVTAPFYALFGYRGLYIIPLLSCWWIWLVFYIDCLKLRVGDLATALGLICLIFGSYLTIYSAMYWEHTLAVALSFSGLSLWFFSPLKTNKFSAISNQKNKYRNFVEGKELRDRITKNSYDPTTYTSIISGFLIGLAVWFRPETVCVVVVMLGLAILNFIIYYWQNLTFVDIKQLRAILFSGKQQLCLVSAMLATVIGFFISNKIIYGYAVGIHGIQVVESVTISDRLIAAWGNFTDMTVNLGLYFPILAIPILYLLFYIVQKNFFSHLNLIQFTILDIVIYLSIIAFVIGVSLLVPVGTSGLIAGGKQWGVRFLLLLVPVITLLAVIQFQRLQNHKYIRYFAIFLFILLTAIGIHINSLKGTQILKTNSKITAPIVNFIKTDNHQYIAVSHQFVAQELEASTSDGKIFFTVDTVDKLIQFAKAMIQQQQNQFIYICYPYRSCNLPNIESSNLQFKQENKNYEIRLTSQSQLGKYPLYKGNIVTQ